MEAKDIGHLKSHLNKWEKDWQLTATYRLAGYHVTNHVETAPPTPAPVY